MLLKRLIQGSDKVGLIPWKKAELTIIDRKTKNNDAKSIQP